MREAASVAGTWRSRSGLKWALAAIVLAVPTGQAAAEPLIIESWRNDDLVIWQDQIIPACNAKHPDIEVVFAPSAPAEYNAALNAKLEAGTAGDLITCRPFDASLALFLDGHLESLNGLSGETTRLANPKFDADSLESDNNVQFFVLRKTLAVHYELPGDPRSRNLAKPTRVKREWVMR